MKIVEFGGGLGNQLFAYMYYMYIRATTDKRVYAVYHFKDHNGFELCKYFDAQIKMNAFSLFLVKLLGHISWKYHSKIADSFFIKEDKKGWKWSFICRGIWQNKKYFKKEAIQFKDLPLSERNKVIKHKMLNCNSVAIHIRRGDYLSPQYYNWYWHLDETDYYQKAIEHVKKKFENCSFFVFSDDIAWCKENMKFEDANYIDWNKGDDSVYDMYLMSLAKVNVIANSTFSFWGAYLNKNSEMTIYPNRWYREDFPCENPDIFPADWIGL